jgi:hypothetical protein
MEIHRKFAGTRGFKMLVPEIIASAGLENSEINIRFSFSPIYGVIRDIRCSLSSYRRRLLLRLSRITGIASTRRSYRSRDTVPEPEGWEKNGTWQALSFCDKDVEAYDSDDPGSMVLCSHIDLVDLSV